MNQEHHNTAKNFFTYDLGCASALIASGKHLVELDKSNPRKVRFVFAKADNTENIVQNYWNDVLNVKAQSYFNAIKSLKNQIFSN